MGFNTEVIQSDAIPNSYKEEMSAAIGTVSKFQLVWWWLLAYNETEECCIAANETIWKMQIHREESLENQQIRQLENYKDQPYQACRIHE